MGGTATFLHPLTDKRNVDSPEPSQSSQRKEDQALEPIFVDSSKTAHNDLPQEEQEPDKQEQTEGEVGDETEEKGAPESEGDDKEGTRPEGEMGKKERSEGGLPNPPGD